jgi:hypothetical protein
MLIVVERTIGFFDFFGIGNFLLRTKVDGALSARSEESQKVP